ncbi:hypothetical protein AX15_004890 [Amanita polypyramis BW_CC]|nr:hypothetical protein AX15_004890 [Amanita polypyramis BW_CC]
MSFAPSRHKNKKPPRDSPRDSPAAGSGGSSPVIVQRSVSSTNAPRPTSGSARDTGNVTVRSASYAHMASHVRAAAAPTTPTRSNQSPARQLSRSPRRETSLLGMKPTRPANMSPGGSRSSNNRREISLNSPPNTEAPSGPLQRLPFRIVPEASGNAEEEREVQEMTSPDKAQAEIQPGVLQEILERVMPLSDDTPILLAPATLDTTVPGLSCFGQASDFTAHGRFREIQNSVNDALARQQRDFSMGMSHILTEIHEFNITIQRELRESNDTNRQIQVALLEELRQLRSQHSHSGRELSPHDTVRSRSPALSYVSREPQDVPECISSPTSRHTSRSTMPAEPDENNELIDRLDESGELDALVALKKLEFRHLVDEHGNFANRRGWNESVQGYDARIATSTRNAILTDLRAGMDPATIFERLSLYRRQTRFEDPPRREPFLTGTNATPLGVPSRNIARNEVLTQTRPHGSPTPSSPSSAGGGSPNDRVPRDSRYLGRMPGIRPSMSASNAGRNPITVGPLTIIDRSSERTDDMVRNEIMNALQAVERRSDVVNIRKLMKMPLPEYSGSESMDSYMKFLRELLLYLLNYNLMKLDSDAHRVSILGVTLKDRALRWYQHTINLNADGRWDFQSAMIELK